MGTPREGRAYKILSRDTQEEYLGFRYRTVEKSIVRTEAVDPNQSKRYGEIVRLELKKDMPWKRGDYAGEVTISRINVDGTIVLSNGQVIDPLDL